MTRLEIRTFLDQYIQRENFPKREQDKIFANDIASAFPEECDIKESLKIVQDKVKEIQDADGHIYPPGVDAWHYYTMLFMLSEYFQEQEDNNYV